MGRARVGQSAPTDGSKTQLFTDEDKSAGQEIARARELVVGAGPSLSERQSPGFRYKLVCAKAEPGTNDQPVRGVVCGHALASCDGEYAEAIKVMTPGKQHRFRVALLSGTPPMFVGFFAYVEAADEQAAIEAAARGFKITDALRDRMSPDGMNDRGRLPSRQRPLVVESRRLSGRCRERRYCEGLAPAQEAAAVAGAKKSMKRTSGDALAAFLVQNVMARLSGGSYASHGPSRFLNRSDGGNVVALAKVSTRSKSAGTSFRPNLFSTHPMHSIRSE